MHGQWSSDSIKPLFNAVYVRMKTEKMSLQVCSFEAAPLSL